MKIRIKQYRMKRIPKILQDELAEHVNMKPAQISQMENGHYIPSLKVALTVAKSFSDLLGERVHVDDLWIIEKNNLK